MEKEMDSHEAEYRGAIEGMAETYGIPASHVSHTEDGQVVVFWVDGQTGHLRHGAVLMANPEMVVVKVTKTAAALVPREHLKAVPRFFGGGGA